MPGSKLRGGLRPALDYACSLVRLGSGYNEPETKAGVNSEETRRTQENLRV